MSVSRGRRWGRGRDIGREEEGNGRGKGELGRWGGGEAEELVRAGLALRYQQRRYGGASRYMDAFTAWKICIGERCDGALPRGNSDSTVSKPSGKTVTSCPYLNMENFAGFINRCDYLASSS